MLQHKKISINRKTKFLCVFLFLRVVADFFAQTVPPPIPPPPPPGLPIDMGISLLLGIGVYYGILKNHKKE